MPWCCILLPYFSKLCVWTWLMQERSHHLNKGHCLWEDAREMQSSSASSVVSMLRLLNCFGHNPALQLSLIYLKFSNRTTDWQFNLAMGLGRIPRLMQNQSHLCLHLGRTVHLQPAGYIKIIACERTRLVLFVRNLIVRIESDCVNWMIV